MNLIHVADVGDGLCMAIGTLAGSVVQIDVGGKDPQTALCGIQRIVSHLGSPNAFILSHFHIDHYNGLLQVSKSGILPYRITEVFFPRVPDFADRSTFLECLFAMNARVFGSLTGSMEYDLLEAVSKLNGRQPFRWRSLFKGENLNVHGSIFEVL
jgi:glyoxylase-like metal-dependent hydrolase (beta-lactamase superfamily II)